MDLLRGCVSDIHGKLSDASVMEERRIASVNGDPIPISEFVPVWRQRSKCDQLCYEFKAIIQQQGPLRYCEEACNPNNRMKNCPGNVVPYEHNRVELEANAGDSQSGYINASWIDGYQKKRAYIATQGPIVRTMNDFWHMVWHYNVPCIIMATNLFEHARQQCEKYWHNIHGRYGGVDVWLENTFATSEYTIRNFRISFGGYTRRVRQLQFQSWSDTEPPQIGTVIEVRRKMKEWMANHDGPIVVHCSNGGGRTGTFIAIDTVLNQYEARDNINIFQTALKLRRSRPFLIGTPDQYQFVYRVTANFIVSGYTVIRASEIFKYVKGLTGKNDKSGGFEEELKNINHFVTPLCVGECAGGHRAENRWKSRDIMIQPPERARPYVLTHEPHASNSTDYINAVYIDGYRAINQFIITQWPLKNTVNDVWRLVHDHSVTVIVVLHDTVKHTRSYPVFWPTTKGVETKFGPFNLELFEDYDANEFVRIRQIRMRKIFSHQRINRARQVCFLQLMCWPNKQKVPDSTIGLIEIMKLTEEWSARLNSSGPALIMSRDGVSRVGPFCVAFICLDRLRSEGEVDVYRAVGSVKKNRPQIVDGIDEYIYCYTCVSVLVESLQSGRLSCKPAEANCRYSSGFEDEMRKMRRSFTVDCIRQPSPPQTRLPDICSDDPLFQVTQSGSSSSQGYRDPHPRQQQLANTFEEEEEEDELDHVPHHRRYHLVESDDYDYDDDYDDEKGATGTDFTDSSRNSHFLFEYI